MIGNGNWYVVNANVTNPNRIRVGGTANIILCDGAKLEAKAGISVSDGNTLNIYGQSADSGELIANGLVGFAGIGSGKSVKAGTVNIYGGTVTATGAQYGTGIGGGYMGDGGDVTVYGGTVNATGGRLGAGIGGGENGSAGTQENGGGVFVVIYLLFLIIMGIPVLTMELAVGRAGKGRWNQGVHISMEEPSLEKLRENQGGLSRVQEAWNQEDGRQDRRGVPEGNR